MFFLYHLYSFVSLLCYPFLIILLKIRLIKQKESKERWCEKLGFYSQKRPKGKLVWLHVASLGEMNSVINLIKHLSVNTNVLLTSTTLTSANNFVIKKLYKSEHNTIIHQFAPLDSILCVKRFLSHFKPDIACIIESEIWPNMIVRTSQVCKIFSVNTSISPKNLERWKQTPKLFKWIFNHFTLVIPSSRYLAGELSKLSINHVNFVGNLKYDLALSIPQENFPRDKKIVCLANIHSGEELELISTIKAISKEDLRIVLIPRHTNKVQNMIKNLKDHNIECSLKSQNTYPEKNKIFIVDEMGINSYFYSISNVIFMGGSLVKIGGHNILEATYFAKPVIIGEFYFKCKEVVEEFLEKEAVIICSSNNLTSFINQVLKDEAFAEDISQKAKACSRKHLGASSKIARIISAFL